MQTALVILIVMVAAIYVGRRFYRQFTVKDDCACGCSGCGVADACDAPMESQTKDGTH